MRVAREVLDGLFFSEDAADILRDARVGVHPAQFRQMISGQPLGAQPIGLKRERPGHQAVACVRAFNKGAT